MKNVHKLDNFMASNSLKNNIFAGPTQIPINVSNMPGQWSQSVKRAEPGWQSSRGKVAHRL